MNQDIKEIREKYLPGMKVRLIKKEDDQAPPIGTEGIVHSVDAIGSVKVSWSTGSTLSIIIGEDEIEIINENESSEGTVYNAYSEEADITFILEDKNNSTSVVGFYYGKPRDDLTKKYYGKLKVIFD